MTSSLVFLTESCGESAGMFPSISFFLEQLYVEGVFRRTAEEAATTTTTTTSSGEGNTHGMAKPSKQARPASSQPLSQVDVNRTPLHPAPVESVRRASQSEEPVVASCHHHHHVVTPETPARRVGGIAPPSRYTPLAKARSRPLSAPLGDLLPPQPTTSNQAPMITTRGNVPAEPAQLEQPQQQVQQQPLPPQQARTSEFVDRWMEKLYFRNPVVVKQRSRSTGPQQPPPPSHYHSKKPSPADAATSQQDTSPTSSAAPPPPVVVASHHVKPTDVVLAQLPPKPASRNASRAVQIRNEIVHERLVQSLQGAVVPAGDNASELSSSRNGSRAPSPMMPCVTTTIRAHRVAPPLAPTAAAQLSRTRTFA